MSWLWFPAALAAPTLVTPDPTEGDVLVVSVSGAVGPVTLLAAPGTPLPPASPALGASTLRLVDAEWLATVVPDPLGDAATIVSVPSGSAGETWSVVAIDAAGVSAPSVFTVQPGPQAGPDDDQDGLPDALEAVYHGLVYAPDTDGDGLLDGAEVFVHATSPANADTDGDQSPDGVEVALGTDPNAWDTDGGGASDGEEAASGTDPRDDADDDHAGNDWDGDGLPDRVELRLGTRAWDPDFDQDGLLDGAEVFVHGTDPRSADPDADSVPDPQELADGTDPWQWDTDGGGASDREELDGGTDPLTPGDDDHAGGDWDLDGLPDRVELRLGTRPWDPDGDADGLLDGAEHFTHGTDPRNRDTDAGGESDGSEVLAGRDPLAAVDDQP
jgi:hypothetical protein